MALSLQWCGKQSNPGFGAFNGRDPWVRASRHDQFVIIDRYDRPGVDHFLLAVDGNRTFANENVNAVLFVVTFTYQRQFFRSMMRKVGRQVNAIVGFTGFFTKNGNIELAGICFIEEILNKTVPTMPLPIIASLTLLIFASISFLLLPT